MNPSSPQQPNFGGLRVAAFESRRAGDIANLIQKAGGVPLVSPSLREVAIEDNPAAIDFAHRLVTGGVDIVILLTGVGFRHLLATVERHLDRQRFLDALADITTICRGPKPVVAMVAGYAIGGGHVLHVVCDLTIAADNARFGQTGPKVGSFDGGLGSSYLARIVGQKKAREIWYLCRQYDAQQALDMGLVNTVVPLAELENETLKWCREMLAHSPLALRCLKSALNADCDGQMGLLDLAGNATLLYYMSEEAKEGKQAFIERRKPDFSKFPRVP